MAEEGLEVSLGIAAVSGVVRGEGGCCAMPQGRNVCGGASVVFSVALMLL